MKSNNLWRELLKHSGLGHLGLSPGSAVCRYVASDRSPAFSAPICWMGLMNLKVMVITGAQSHAPSGLWMWYSTNAKWYFFLEDAVFA